MPCKFKEMDFLSLQFTCVTASGHPGKNHDCCTVDNSDVAEGEVSVPTALLPEFNKSDEKQS